MIVPKLALIAARAKNGVIGRDGDLPWRLKSDLAWFKRVTLGKPIIMGRKTWESLPRKPLPGRANYVVTRQTGYQADGAIVCASLSDALDEAFMQADCDGLDEVCVIGGAQLYGAAIKTADRLYLTEIDASPQGDTVFPEFDEDNWIETHREACKAGEGDDHDYVLRTLNRITRRD